MKTLFEPVRLGPLALKNRAVRSATNEHLSSPDGQPTESWAHVLTELAEHRLGLIVTGHITVERTQRSDEGQVVLDRETDMTLFSTAAHHVHRCGGKLLAQLSHSGVKAGPVNGIPPKTPADFTLEELDKLVEAFIWAAKACKEAGLDGVQIHNAHGYCLSNFLNPTENLRTDDYGGSLENRFRLVRRILDGVRSACGKDFALIVKADVNGCGDLPALIWLYEETEIDGIELSGVDFAARAGQKTPFYQKEMESIQTRLPLILTGGIFTRETAEAALAAGADFVGFCRSLICEPDFIRRMEEGTASESRCLACNGCYRVYRSRPVRCVTHTEPLEQLKLLYGAGYPG